MERVFDWRNRARARAALIVLAATIASGCAEEVDGGEVCPALCPAHPLSTQQVTVPVDSIVEPTPTLIGYPPRGTEVSILVTNRPDTLDTRMVVRFDTIPPTYTGTDGDPHPIVAIDSVGLRLRFDSSRVVGRPITLNVYDVDTTAHDSSDAAILALFRPDRLVGTTVLTVENRDTVTVPLDSAFVISRVLGGQRIRLGIQAVGAGSVEVSFYGSEDAGGRFPLLRFDPSTDSGIVTQSFAPRSRTPAKNALVAFDLADYRVVAMTNAPPPAGAFALGGWPGRRALLHFRLPADVVDSSSVVRAILTLHQIPAPSPDGDDTLQIQAHPISASATVTDPARQALLASPVALSSAPVRPAADSTITIDVGALVRAWAGQDTLEVVRLLVLRAEPEGTSRIAWFYGTDAPAPVRPSVTIVYIPRAEVGLP